MPPRLLPATALQSFNLSSLLTTLPVASNYVKNGICATCAYTFSAKGPMTYKKQHKSRLKPHRNPYREAQAKQRKAANQARQKVLQEQRIKAMGDPVRSIPTPFIESLAIGHMPGESTKEEPRNYFLGPDELPESLQYSNKLSAPYIPRRDGIFVAAEIAPSSAPAGPVLTGATESQEASASSWSDPPVLPIEHGDTTLPSLEPSSSTNPSSGSQSNRPTQQQAISLHKYEHKNATRALSVISSLANGSSSDLTRHNIQRCISTFGRHVTDRSLPPRPPSIYNLNNSSTTKDAPSPSPSLRAGPDTGSSEVQIAILTTKINVLANNLHKRDMHNKRNLRLLVHRRQKLLAYLRRSERGGPRWRNLVEKLGIQDAMWKGEISL